MFVLSFYTDNLLTPSLEEECKPAEEIFGSEEKIHGEDYENLSQSKTGISSLSGFGLLDLSGPELIHGFRFWIYLYTFLGQLNIPGKPLYWSIVYKLLVLSFSNYVIISRILMKELDMKLLQAGSRNPIFLFISASALLISSAHVVLVLYNNLFRLSPLFKILSTSKLCFVNHKVQETFGHNTKARVFLLCVYNTMLCHMLSCKDIEHFWASFELTEFVLELYAITVITFYTIGLSHFDFYIRSCFGAWILGLKSNLECRFMHFQHLQRLLKHSQQSSGCTERGAHVEKDLQSTVEETADSWVRSAAASSQSERLINSFKSIHRFVNLDEIQRSLNNMDDHLEVWRSVQTTSLALITLNAFLVNGALFMFAYNLIAKTNDLYHGILMILLAFNYSIGIFLCYIGDRWIYYSLSRLVQTVEDQYFMQDVRDSILLPNVMKTSEWVECTKASRQATVLSIDSNSSSVALSKVGSATDAADDLEYSNQMNMLQKQFPCIKKQDVLFCREFLCQFDNHLATPWSCLNVKTHINILGTFVTLIAAQIIFDHEHAPER